LATHSIESDEHTLHSFFSPDLPPVLTVDPGDSVRFRTLDAGWGLEPFVADGRPRRRASSRHGEISGHALCGPVQVRGAQPGHTLAVRVAALRPGAWGWTRAGGEWAGNVDVLHRWAIDPDAGTAVNQHGHRVALSPFMGVMGNAPAEPGRHSTIPPRAVGGNLDCKELTVGSTLYLPVAVDGARFSTGDGHARQGDGELSGTAIECPMELCELGFSLCDDLPISAPVAETAAGWLTMGIGASLNDACAAAIAAMIDLMLIRYAGLERPDAVALASVTVDLRITQIVNQVCGVHALLPHGAIG
jgi:acetamidase/formamidase